MQLPLTRARLVAASLALVLLCSGCASIHDPGDEAAAPGATGCSPADLSLHSSTPETESANGVAPRLITGPSTACIDASAIPSVAQTPQARLPVTVVDNQGTSVTVTDTSRILALDVSGTLATTVNSLGLGGNLVGRDVATSFPGSEDLPLVTTGGHSLNGEAILGLAPTVLLTDSSVGPWDVVMQVRDAGIPVVVLTPERSFENVGALTEQVADALGVAGAGEKLAADIEARLADVEGRITALAPSANSERVRMIFLYVRGGAGVYYVFGEGSGADSLIERLGGIDVAAEVGIAGSRPITAEGLVSAAPDLVLVMSKGLESVGGVDGLLEAVPALAQTPAGQNRRIVDMADSEILGFGPRSPAVLEALAEVVYPG